MQPGSGKTRILYDILELNDKRFFIEKKYSNESVAVVFSLIFVIFIPMICPQVLDNFKK